MSRPTWIELNIDALTHNIVQLKQWCSNKKIIAMVKANAYGCGIEYVVPVLAPHVQAFGVACIEEARVLREYSSIDCVLFQGVFEPLEWMEASILQLSVVIHQKQQLDCLLKTRLKQPIHLWIKIDTGMHRLGFAVEDVPAIIDALMKCDWVHKPLGLMTHFACADDKHHPLNQIQIERFKQFDKLKGVFYRSVANSAYLLSYPNDVYDVVRPGILLYGISPIKENTGETLGLQPVMSFYAKIIAIRMLIAGESVGYGGDWVAPKQSIIGVISVGYGDGYPRFITNDAFVYVQGKKIPIVGRISMDMMTIDLTDCPDCIIGDVVELWGAHLPIESVANVSATIPYELLCKLTQRVRDRIQLRSSFVGE